MINIGNTFILGDSYSTFEGFIPQGYKAYYTTAEKEETDVNQVEQTWWHQLLAETDATLLKNCSYSGTTICNTGYDGKDSKSVSFVARFDKLLAENYFYENKINTFFLFGGTNDSWANSPIGELMYSDWEKEDLFSVLPAFCYLIHKICINLPDAKVFCVLNTELKSDIRENFKTACKRYDVNVIQLDEFDKKCGHPTVKGMKQIKEQIMEYIK